MTSAALIITDVIAILAALLLGLFLRQYALPIFSDLFPTRADWRHDYLSLLVIMLGVFAYEGLYTKRRIFWEELRAILRGVTAAMILFLAAMTVLKSGEEVSRPVLVLAWAIAPGLLTFTRLWMKRNWLGDRSFWMRRILIIGSCVEGGKLVDRLNLFPELGYRVIGFLGDHGPFPGEGEGIVRFGALTEYVEVVKSQAVDEVIIAMPDQSRLKQFEILKGVEKLVRRVHVLPELFDVDKLNVEIENIERHFLLSFNNNLMKRSNRIIKSIFEIIIIIASFPLWAPLLVFLSILVKASSPGPVYFRQQRIGAAGEPFWCYKFRTMVTDANERLRAHLLDDPGARAEWDAEHKLKNDPRITRLGRFLRKTSLDELPQIFNILKGEMSLVGPRPVVREEVDKYGEFFEYYQSVCPGLSGLWQVSGRNDVSYDERVLLDTFYVRNWSLWLDFMILLKTIPAVFKKEGAY